MHAMPETSRFALFVRDLKLKEIPFLYYH